MPKPFLPPQGGEKWLCLGMFLTLMFSIICIVVAIYCIVIIYDPSVKELYSEISPDAKRCTTTLIERNITGTPEDQKCNWSSCEEWCLSKGASPCSKVYGIVRHRGADMSWEKCELQTRDLYEDHLCTTLEDLEPMNCKRSKWELDRPGSVEDCRQYNNLISCQGGECLNVSMIYKCSYIDTLEALKEPTGNEGFVTDGYCNCNQCTHSNTTVVKDALTGELFCPKDTRYCFEKDRHLKNYTAERKAMCAAGARCQTCQDICQEVRNCLSMHSRQDVAYFGVDMTKDPPEKKLIYYTCKQGVCTAVHTLKCKRTCDYKEFNFDNRNLVLFQGERIVMANCKEAYINDTVEKLPMHSPVNKDWRWMAATCSQIKIDPEMNTIYGSDCTNGTWLGNLGKTNYSHLTDVYAEAREDRRRFIKTEASVNESMIPLEEDISIFKNIKILKNMEGCVNTLSMECMHFYAKYGRDGANYTALVSYDCYFDENNDEYVVVDFTPEMTQKFLVFWTFVPAGVILFSCAYICICSKFMYTGEDGHMRVYIMGRAVTGIGHVVVYKPPPKKEKPKKPKPVAPPADDPVAI